MCVCLQHVVGSGGMPPLPPPPRIFLKYVICSDYARCTHTGSDPCWGWWVWLTRLVNSNRTGQQQTRSVSECKQVKVLLGGREGGPLPYKNLCQPRYVVIRSISQLIMFTLQGLQYICHVHCLSPTLKCLPPQLTMKHFLYMWWAQTIIYMLSHVGSLPPFFLVLFAELL